MERPTVCRSKDGDGRLLTIEGRECVYDNLEIRTKMLSLAKEYECFELPEEYICNMEPSMLANVHGEVALISEPDTPFTKAEDKIMQHLVEVHNEFLDLGIKDDAEVAEWVLAMHNCQRILMARALARKYPERFK